MPKCQDYECVPEVRAVLDGGPCYYWPVCDDCHGHGWLPFWTPEERAGLKAMGSLIKWRVLGPHSLDAVKRTIGNFVKAARAAKGAK